ncbi:MAG TPA: c-type cytochrome [Povalibacter sp.]|uniref:c-type cytochrome n=1 Tax=Povalibacter sp. TaxID=1962978 RepID=UPI002B5EC8F6|nr:c-type cytochrome [Povalibacter sp.]HMN46593.1 c-type cytochrome [Povalibacter sp.]
MKRRSFLSACLIAATAMVVAPVTTPATQRSADQIYQSFCGACHGTGWNGAPISGIENDWTPRLGNGVDAMLANVKQGLNTMPPMGTCNDCSDAELKAAIEFMLKF